MITLVALVDFGACFSLGSDALTQSGRNRTQDPLAILRVKAFTAPTAPDFPCVQNVCKDIFHLV